MQVTRFSDCVDWDFKNQEWIIGQHLALPDSLKVLDSGSRIRMEMPPGCPQRLQEFLVHWSWGEPGDWPVAFSVPRSDDS